MQRIMRHIILFVAGSVTGVAFYFALPSPPTGPFYWLSMASAYVSLVLLGLSLVIGPWNKLRVRPNPVSTHLRRDIGIWAGVAGIVHVIAGLESHMGGKYLLYFLPPGIATFPFPLTIGQWLPFGLANHAGLVATSILLLLLSLSNNASLRALGASRWKSLQRWNYAYALFVVVHSVGYYIMAKRMTGYVVAFAVVVLITLAMQFAGFRMGKKQT